MRTDLIGGLLGAGAHNLARGAERVALFESGRVYLPERPPAGGGPSSAGDFAGTRPAPVAEPHRIGCAARRSAPGRDLARRPRRRGLLRRQGARRADRRGALGVEVERRAGDPAVPASGASRARCWSSGRADRLGRRAPPERPRPDRRARRAPRSRSTPARCSPRPWSGSERFEDVTTFPAIERGHRRRRRPRAPRGRGARGACEAAAGELLRSASIFDVYEGEQVPRRASAAWRCGSSSRAPDRTLTDAEVAERRAAIVDALAAIGATPPWLSRGSRSPASRRPRPRRRRLRASPARSPPSSSGVIPGSSSSTRPRAPTPARGSTRLYPRYRVRDRADRARRRRGRGLRRGDRRLPARRRGAGRRRPARARAARSSTSPPTSASATRTSTPTGTASWPRPSSSARPSTG